MPTAAVIRSSLRRPGAAYNALIGVLRGQSTGHRLLQAIGIQVLVVALNIGTGVLSARVLGPDGRGIFAAITLWPQLIATVSAAGLPYSVVYHTGGPVPGARRAIGAALLLGVAMGLIGAALGATLIPQIMRPNYPAYAVEFAQATTIVALLNLLVTICRQALVGRGRLRDFNTASWLDPALYLVLLVLAWRLKELSAYTAALCMYGAGALGLVWTARRLWRVCPPRFHMLHYWIPRIASYAGRAAGVGVLAGLSAYLDRLVLIFALPPRELGLYAVAYSLSRLANVVQTAVGAVVLPAMRSSGITDAKTLHDRTFGLVLSAMLLGCGCALLLGKPAMVMLYGPSFAAADRVLLVLVVEAALACLAQVVLQLFLALGRPGYTSWMQTAGFAVTVLGFFTLVPTFGALGAALAMAAGSSVRLIALLFGVKTQLRLTLPSLRAIVADLRVVARGGAS